MVHFKLGATLGKLMSLGHFWRLGRIPDRDPQAPLAASVAPDTDDLCNAALAACRRAIELDVEFGNARNEVGIILSNVGRHEEAEESFAEAEPYHGHHAHHWFCRGNNYIALERYEDAARALHRAMEFNRGGDHVDARIALAATYMALGRADKARSIGQPIASRLGKHPADHWRAIIGSKKAR